MNDLAGIISIARELPSKEQLIGSSTMRKDKWIEFYNGSSIRNIQLEAVVKKARRKGYEGAAYLFNIGYIFFLSISALLVLGISWGIIDVVCAAHQQDKTARSIYSFLREDAIWRFDNGSQLIFSAYGVLVGMVMLYFLLRSTGKFVEREMCIREVKQSLSNT